MTEPIVVPSSAGPQNSIDISGGEALSALTQIVSAASDYGRIRQQEHTKREAIAAFERSELRRLQAAETTLRLYFDMVFAERAKTNMELFARLDQAVASGDPQMVHAVVRGIVDLAQASPLKDLGDFGKFWGELGTPDNPIEL
jgi:hypothetical protein